MGNLFQNLADRIDAAYQPKPAYWREGRAELTIDCIFGSVKTQHDYDYHETIQIVDFYHGADHAGEVVEALLGSKEHPEYKARLSRWVRRLLGNGVKNLIGETRQQYAGKPQAQKVYEELGYFRSQHRTDAIPDLSAAGLINWRRGHRSRCKTVVGSRCKQSGMFWGKPGDEDILALRCIHASRRRRRH